MNFRRFFFISLSVCCFVRSTAQDGTTSELDSLEQRLSEIHKSQPQEAIELGGYVLRNSASEIQRSRVMGLMAVSYFIENDINKSTELLFQAKDEAEKTGNHELIAKMYGSIAHQYVQLDLNDKAKFYLDKAIAEINRLSEGNNKHYLKGLSFLELGNITIDEKNYRKANENYKESLDQFQKMIEPGNYVVYHYRRSLYNIGNSFVYLNEPDSAEIYLNKALEIKSAESPDLNDFIYTTLAQVYAQKGDYKRAVDSLLTVLENGRLNNNELKAEIYLDLSRNYKKLNENEKYIFYNERYLSLNDSLRQNNLKAINTAIEQEQKGTRLKLADAGRKNEILIISGIIFFVILLMTVAVLIYKRQKERALFERIITGLKAQQDILPLALPENQEAGKKEASAPNAVEEEILGKLEKFEQSEKFTNSRLTISSLAVHMKTNTTYLSEVINQYKGKNFNAYINELRIKYICEKIYQHPEYLNYKISYLAEESGFASHSAFATVFKSVTGISPSAFLREAAKRESYKPKMNK